MEARILTGNVGTGKSTYALNQFFGLDDWVCWNYDAYTIMLNFGKYKYSPEKLGLLHGGLKDFLRRTIPSYNIVVDTTNINKTKRKSVLTMIKNVLKEKDLPESTYDFTCVDFGPGDKVSLNRRIKNSPSESVVWAEVHKKFTVMYESPDPSEGFSSIIDGSTLEVK